MLFLARGISDVQTAQHEIVYHALCSQDFIFNIVLDTTFDLLYGIPFYEI